MLKNHLVSATHLLAVAQRLELGRYLQLGRGEETAGGRTKQRLLVNAFEAVLAAVYLDGGVNAARGLLVRYALPPTKSWQQLAGPARHTIFAPNWSVSRGTGSYPGHCTPIRERTDRDIRAHSPSKCVSVRNMSR